MQKLKTTRNVAILSDTQCDRIEGCPAGTGKKPIVTEPDQIQLAPGKSIQQASGFGLQQGPSTGGGSTSSSAAQGA